MIRLGYQSDQGPVMFFGLTAENVKRLMTGDPIWVKANSMGRSHPNVMIAYGNTPLEIVKELRAAGIQLPPEAERAAVQLGEEGG